MIREDLSTIPCSLGSLLVAVIEVNNVLVRECEEMKYGEFDGGMQRKVRPNDNEKEKEQ